ncbi:MAG TPA: urate hydroxylase PuuD [Candidatus Baltobacteraceae bacterium]|nr:urate hydroxylase PuuD [Candidatus Baltobacteraceae bacterium]
MTPAYALDWLNLLVRWFHFVAGISWIGASFYFVWLDNHLVAPLKRDDAEEGVCGELWSVHGGGFYHNQKYLTGPTREPLTHDLHWFKWEAYSTWISGIALMAIVYWAGARTYLIDPSVMALSPSAAIAISIASLFIGWFVYDGLCRVLERRPRLLAASIALFLIFTSWALYHVFSGRAAFLHVGAIIGTIMAANVFFVIIPGQRRMLAQIRAGQRPDPRPGMLGKMRSVHNTYLTLPVLFLMISNHYPMLYSGAYGWLVLVALAAAGVLVRYFFILTHKARLVWALPAAAAVVIVATAISLAPRMTASAGATPVSFAQVAPIFAQRCAVCHAAHPTQPGFDVAPAGVLLDTPAHIAANAPRVLAQAVQTQAMPLGNVTGMTQAERTLVGTWIDQGAKI